MLTHMATRLASTHQSGLVCGPRRPADARDQHPAGSSPQRHRTEISYHPQSGWFEDTPLKGGTEEGCPLKGVHEGTCLLRLGSVRRTTLELLSSHRSTVCPLSIARRIALGAVVGCGEAGLPHKMSSAPPQRRNGRAFSSLTARGGGLPFGVSRCMN